jgi:hypothetical protein
MENQFNISIRLSSDTINFKNLIPVLNDYKFVYNEKGKNLIKTNKKNTFHAKANILIIKDVYITNSIESDYINIVKKLEPLMDLLTLINLPHLRREVYISGSIENQQFGFSVDQKFIDLLSKFNYMLSFSGIFYL